MVIWWKVFSAICHISRHQIADEMSSEWQNMNADSRRHTEPYLTSLYCQSYHVWANRGNRVKKTNDDMLVVEGRHNERLIIKNKKTSIY